MKPDWHSEIMPPHLLSVWLTLWDSLSMLVVASSDLYLTGNMYNGYTATFHGVILNFLDFHFRISFALWINSRVRSFFWYHSGSLACRSFPPRQADLYGIFGSAEILATSLHQGRDFFCSFPFSIFSQKWYFCRVMPGGPHAGGSPLRRVH